MKRLSLVETFLLAVVLFAPCLVSAADSEEIAPSQGHSFVVLEGTIGGALEVRLYLTIDPGGEGEGARRASGWYEYESIDKPISLSGSFGDGGELTLEESLRTRTHEESKVTGRFRGAWKEEGDAFLSELLHR